MFSGATYIMKSQHLNNTGGSSQLNPPMENRLAVYVRRTLECSRTNVIWNTEQLGRLTNKIILPQDVDQNRNFFV